MSIPRVDVSALADQFVHLDRALHVAVASAGCRDRRLGAAMHAAVFPGGKRWRALLALSSAQMAGGDWREAVSTAAAVELLHCSSLVFDDLPCMDDAQMRRGRPAVHVEYGSGVAILAGLGLLTTAYDLLARSPQPSKAVWLASRHLGPRDMLGGQALDLGLAAADASSGAVPEASLRTQRDRKTSGLITLSLLVGALHGELERRRLVALVRVGRELGNAFQMADDLKDADADALSVSPRVLSARLSGCVERAVTIVRSAFGPSTARERFIAIVLSGLATTSNESSMVVESFHAVPPSAAQMFSA